MEARKIGRFADSTTNAVADDRRRHGIVFRQSLIVAYSHGMT